MRLQNLLQWKLLSGSCVFASLTVSLLIVGSNTLIERSTKDDVFLGDVDFPDRAVALVLGCSRYLTDGRANVFFMHRIDRAAQLFREGVISHIIVSGDNSRHDYDEPSDMRAALIEKGVPVERIYSDYAGFSTLDSVIRAKEVFKQSRLIVISQEFHVRRAVYIGKRNDLDIVGVAARDVAGYGGWKTHLREYLARVKTVLDIHIFKRGPRFLGEPVLIDGEA